MAKRTNYTKTTLFILALCFLTLIILTDIQNKSKTELAQLCTDMHTELLQNAFASVAKNTQAKALYAYDFSKNEPLFGKNESMALPLASLTKLMTIRIALKNVSLNDFYTVTSRDIGFDDPLDFAPGDTFRIEDLTRAALIASSNDSAVMLGHSTNLSDAAFLKVMNTEAALLHLPSLQYESVTGLDINDVQATAVGDAADTLSLLYKDYTDFPAVISLSSNANDQITATNGDRITLKNTDIAENSFSLLEASKTGYTDTAGGNLAILWRNPAHELLGAIVLGSTESGRFTDMQTLYKATNLFVASSDSFPSVCNNQQ